MGNNETMKRCPKCHIPGDDADVDRHALECGHVFIIVRVHQEIRECHACKGTGVAGGYPALQAALEFAQQQAATWR